MYIVYGRSQFGSSEHVHLEVTGQVTRYEHTKVMRYEHPNVEKKQKKTPEIVTRKHINSCTILCRIERSQPKQLQGLDPIHKIAVKTLRYYKSSDRIDFLSSDYQTIRRITRLPPVPLWKRQPFQDCEKNTKKQIGHRSWI